jgi:hypothetical protein
MNEGEYQCVLVRGEHYRFLMRKGAAIQHGGAVMPTERFQYEVADFSPTINYGFLI